MKVRFLVGILAIWGLGGCSQFIQENNPAREPLSIKTVEYNLEGDRNIPSDSVVVIPIEHQSFVLQLMGRTILVDPTGDLRWYNDFKRADLILITGTHPTHESLSLLKELVVKNTVLVVPEAVKNTLSSSLNKQGQVLERNTKTDFQGIEVEVLFERESDNQEAGRFFEENKGYLVSRKGKRVFISGETGDLIAYKKKEKLDLAFVGMDFNSGKTMEHLREAIVKLKPAFVYPYYYRGPEIYSQVAKLKREIEKESPEVQVQVLNWYPLRDELLL